MMKRDEIMDLVDKTNDMSGLIKLFIEVGVDLRDAIIDGMINAQMKPVQANKPVKANGSPLTVEDVVKKLGDDVQHVEVHEFVNDPGNIFVKTKGFLKDREDWYRINNAIKDMGGAWQRQGKDSHWTIPK